MYIVMEQTGAEFYPMLACNDDEFAKDFIDLAEEFMGASHLYMIDVPYYYDDVAQAIADILDV